MSEKKRKMIDVDPAVVEMFARVLQKLKPPPKLTISEWAAVSYTHLTLPTT